MNDIQPTLQTLLNQIVTEGGERGLQVAVYREGQLVADASAGVMDPATNQPVESTTLFPIFSTTKGIAATLLHILVERGRITYDTPIADVWPEFAAHGKGGILVRHALNHTAGVPNMPMGLTHADLGSWEIMCAAIADLTPVSPPGEVFAYHAITYSWTVGEVVRRVDGRSFSQFLHDEVCAPLGISDETFVGLPDASAPRVAHLEMNVDPSRPLPHDATPQAIPALVQPLHEWMNRPDARRACIPGSNGIMSARAIASHYAALLPGGVDGIELLPPARVLAAIEPQRPGNAQPGDAPPSHRLGYHANSLLPGAEFGHGGHGGSLGVANLDHRIAVGFTRNRFVSDSTLPRIAQTLRETLGL